MISSKLVTLSSISEDYFFSVPIYQRLYVWEEAQVNTLLADLLAAYKSFLDDTTTIFYLGGTLVTKNANGGFDLIDGQQRFTTLWMMSIVWGYMGPLKPFVCCEATQRSRIEFSVRDNVNEFFNKLVNKTDANIDDENITTALEIISSFPAQQSRNAFFDLKGFTDFIFNRVQFVMTIVPPPPVTDLNKLFEIINNRGVQLQHHEILKAKMLSQLFVENGERRRFAMMWDACSYMNGYLEKNIKDITGLKYSNLFVNAETDVMSDAGKIFETLTDKPDTKIEPKTLEEILAPSLVINEQNHSKDEIDNEVYESEEVSSIISFSMLLQHTLRIWSAKYKKDLPRIQDKELLELFNSDRIALTRENAIDFIKLLWEVRYLFDNYIIKWVGIGQDIHHDICQLKITYKEKNDKKTISVKRDKEMSSDVYGFALLQSMLYHSQEITTHYWLTPLLDYLHKNRNGNVAQFYEYLRYMDNQLFCTEDKRFLIERTRDFLYENAVVMPHKKICLDDLNNQDIGTKLHRYWFYKMEFILWYQEEKAEWKSYRFTSKNSVEHIMPQKRSEYEKPENDVSPKWLNSFGNLVLLTASKNSERSNNTIDIKRGQFQESRRHKLDSLKEELIFNYDFWNDANVKLHQIDMINRFRDYVGLSEFKKGSRLCLILASTNVPPRTV